MKWINFNLKFNKIKELEYRKARYKSDLFDLRITYAIYIFLYGIFSLADYLVIREHFILFMKIRFYIVIPILVLYLLFTFTKIFFKMQQFATMVTFIAAGVGIAAMLLIAPDNHSYYGGMFMIIFPGFLLIKLYYKNALISFVVILSFYLTGLFFLGLIDSELIYFIIFFVSSGFMGAIGAYIIEKISRENYENRIKLEEDSKKLEKRVNAQVKSITNMQRGTIYALAHLVESRDRLTGNHLEKVGIYCKLLAENLDDKVFLEFDINKERFIPVLEIASALHDIGKITISDSILNKPGKLTKSEFEMMKKHTTMGSSELEHLKKVYPENEFIDVGLQITRHHHERFDGRGYPDGLKGNDIPLSAQIMAVADVYDALVSERPYKDPFSDSKARELIIQGSGSQFNPELVKSFIKAEKKFQKIRDRFAYDYYR